MEVFMLLLGMALVAYISYLAGMRFPSLRKAVSCLKSDVKLPSLGDKSFWHNVYRRKDIQQRCLFTLGMVLLYQLVQFIPVPGLNYNGILDVMHKTSRYGGALSPLPLWGTGKYFSVLLFGVLPYLSACGMLLFLSLFIRPLRRQFFSEQRGRNAIVRLTLYLSLALCALQSFFWTLSVESLGDQLGAFMVVDPGLIFRVVATLSLVAGFCFLLWMAELINKKGIGNGIAMIVLSDLVTSGFRSVRFAFRFFQSQNHPPGSYLLYFLLTAVFIVMVFYVTNWQRTIAFAVKEKQGTFPLRLSWFGRAPVMLAQSIFLFPLTIASFIASQALHELASIVHRGTIIYYIVLGVLIFIAVIIYKVILTDRDYLSQLFRRFDVSFSGDDFMAQFDKTMKKVMPPAAFFLIVLVICPDLILYAWKVPYTVISVFGLGLTSYLILGGILYDTVIQIKARIEAEQRGCGSVCMIASDEIEARVKQTYLEAHGLACVIVPYRLTWGLPIRTALDKYNLQVPQDKLEEARNLLNK